MNGVPAPGLWPAFSGIAAACVLLAVPLEGQTGEACVWPEPDSTDWTREATEFFSLAVPPGFEPQEIGNEDSLRNLWVAETAEIQTDYGPLRIVFGPAPRVQRPNEEDWETCSAIIQGKPVQVVAFRGTDGFSVQAYFRNVRDIFSRIDNGVLWVKITFQDESFRSEAMRVVRSIVFAHVPSLPRPYS